MPANLPLTPHGAAVVASVPQGRDLRNNAEALALSINDLFGGIVAAPPKSKKTVNIGDGLKFTVIGPNQSRLEELLIEWEAVIKKKGLAKNAEGQALAAAFIDESVYNLSSIVVMAEADKKRMLLTGDARGDDVGNGCCTLFTGGCWAATGGRDDTVLKELSRASASSLPPNASSNEKPLPVPLV